MYVLNDSENAKRDYTVQNTHTHIYFRPFVVYLQFNIESEHRVLKRLYDKTDNTT